MCVCSCVHVLCIHFFVSAPISWSMLCFNHVFIYTRAWLVSSFMYRIFIFQFTCIHFTQIRCSVHNYCCIVGGVGGVGMPTHQSRCFMTQRWERAKRCSRGCADTVDSVASFQMALHSVTRLILGPRSPVRTPFGQTNSGQSG